MFSYHCHFLDQPIPSSKHPRTFWSVRFCSDLRFLTKIDANIFVKCPPNLRKAWFSAPISLLNGWADVGSVEIRTEDMFYLMGIGWVLQKRKRTARNSSVGGNLYTLLYFGDESDLGDPTFV